MLAKNSRQLVKNLMKKLGYELISLKRCSTELTESEGVGRLIAGLRPIGTEHKLVRLGPDGDGGYVLPDDLQGIVACFSPGVDKICGFELACAQKGMRVFLADKSVDSPPDSHPMFRFTKKYVGAFGSDDFMTLDEWVEHSLERKDGDLLLQMDIENYEYEVILSMSSELMMRTRILVIEFHSLCQLWNKPFFMMASRVFEKILHTHTCVHIHPNNCAPVQERGDFVIPPIAEFTFLRNDRFQQAVGRGDFPHPLDFDCTNREHIPLPPCWYRG